MLRQFRLIGLAITVAMLLSLSQPGLASPHGSFADVSAQAPAFEGPSASVSAINSEAASRYGPQRTTYENGIPRHAYSPFDKVEEAACPPGGCDSQPGVVLVKLAPEVVIQTSGREAVVVNAGSLNTLMQRHGVTRIEQVFPGARQPAGGVVSDGIEPPQPVPDLTRWVKLYLRSDAADTTAAIEAFQADPNVQVAEPDYLRKPVGQAPDAQERESEKLPPAGGIERDPTLQLPGPGTDPLYSQQWHLGATNVPAAWQWLEDHGYAPGGSRDIVVAVIDTGVDYTHPDLAANMWVNPPEFGGTPGVDDDGNGYVDDIYGADMVTPDGDPQDDHGHGTHVAGIIAAQADNGIGGVGVAYNVQVMALKAAQYSGVLASSDIAEAIYYAVEKGADVINMSFGGYARSQVEEDALAVAFGQAVLVAAAGNDGYYNPPCPPGKSMYPADYNWVLGVMASTASGGLASFSNRDCVPHDSHEYELMAPGMDVWSTLPLGNYAAWDGTSMATPIVSGIAALLRTRWWDKDIYSSRFIMGQIAANASGGAGGVADAYTALTIPPQPELSYLEHWLFDTEQQSTVNDDDGIVDAGETVDLAIVIRNHWGKADPVTVTLEAWAEGAVFPDPYVTMITGTVSYGAIGSFNWDDNGLIYDGEGAIIGVANPFRFTLPISTPNDHVIPFLLTMTAGNGYDPGDPNAPYVTQSRFNLIVQRGRELPTIVSEDMTLTKDYYWLVPDQTLIEAGVTVTVTEGTQIQFWSGDPADPYHGDPDPFIQVEGAFLTLGTAAEPVDLFQWPLFPGLDVNLKTLSGGLTHLAYTRVRNPYVETEGTGSFSRLDHCYLDRDSVSFGAYVNATESYSSIFHKVNGAGTYDDQILVGNLFDSTSTGVKVGYGKANVFLRNGGTVREVGAKVYTPVFLRTIFPIQSSGATHLSLSPFQRGTAPPYLSLDNAELFANQFGGHVVTVNDASENSFLGTYRAQYLTMDAFQSNYPTMDCGFANCWGMFQFDPILGLTDQAVEGVFVWISGQPVTYTNWATGEPRISTGGLVTFDTSSPPFWHHTGQTGGKPFVLELPGAWDQEQVDLLRDEFLAGGAFSDFRGNAILNEWWDPAMNRWMCFSAPTYNPYSQDPRMWRFYITDNYWGTTSTSLIDAAIYDYHDNFNLGRYIYEPLLTTPPEDAYPFVADVVLSTTSDPDANIVGAEPVTFTVTFNRDMDTAVQPAISFGPDVPETDYSVHPVGGGWTNARTWAGTFNVTPVTGDGYQLIRVADAVAADDPWLITGDDAGRFRFEIITSGSQAMNLQANGGEGYVDLMWTQNDFDLLAGYNLYRSTSLDGNYTRLNQTIIPPDQHSYMDTAVQPGQPYYYRFTVVKSDMTESGFSNVATATPVDTIPPVISHTPVTQAPPGLPLSLWADVTDNVGVQTATLYYRPIGEVDYAARTMVHTQGDRWSATLEGSLVNPPGLEYYLEASDGVTTVRHGHPSYPHQVIVGDNPVVTSVTPNHGPTAGGTEVTLSGGNFKAGATVTFGGAAASDVTVVSSSQITCTTPPHFPAAVDVTVTNPGDQSGTLLHGYTYESDVVSLSLPPTGGEQYTVVQVPINAANVDGLAAASLTVAFDPAVLGAQDASTGNLTPGWSLTVNTGTPGEIRLSMASPGGTVSGSGILAYVEFGVIGSPGMTSTLTFDNISLNEGAIPTETTAGSFAVEAQYDVSGMIRFWEDSTGIPGAQLTLEGNRLYTAVSQSDGTYTVSGAGGDDYTLTPAKSDGVNGISAYDASVALQHDAGLISLTGYQAVAADVTKNGTITSMDAFYILQKAVDLISLPFPGAGVVWDFDPTSRSYTDLSSDVTGQDFTGVLLGDISGNWTAGGGGLLSGPLSAAGQLDVQTVQALAGSTVTVLVDLTLIDADLYGIDLSIVYSPSILSALDTGQGSLTEGWMVADNLASPGQLRVSLAGAEPITGDGELLLLAFEVVTTESLTSTVTITSASLNEGQIPVTSGAGGVAVGAGPVVSIEKVGTDAVLRWNSVFGASSYQVYRGTEPYFDLSVDTALAAVSDTVFTDTAAIGDPGTNYYYVLAALDSLDGESAPSNRVGEFDFELRRTTGTDYTWITLPLQNGALNMASDLEQYIETNCSTPVSVLSIARWNAPGQQLVQYTTIPIPIGDFALQTGQAYRVETDVSGADSCIWTLTGTVPRQQSISFDLVTTTGTDYTWISLPLDQGHLGMASELEQAIEAGSGTDVLSICRWNAVGQQFVCYTTVPIPIGDFAIGMGYPYRLEVSSPVSWP